MNKNYTNNRCKYKKHSMDKHRKRVKDLKKQKEKLHILEKDIRPPIR